MLLVRKGGFAVAPPARLRIAESKVGQRHVQGRTKAGGQSQQRFARRRDNQARQAYEAAADHAARILAPGLTALVSAATDRPSTPCWRTRGWPGPGTGWSDPGCPCPILGAPCSRAPSRTPAPYASGSRTPDHTPSADLDQFKKMGQTPTVPPASDAQDRLRAAGLRVTRPRMAVLDAVHDHPHTDTDSLIAVVRSNLGEVSHQAVYDVLRALTSAGLVRRIQPPGSVPATRPGSATTTTTSCAGAAAPSPTSTAPSATPPA